jgi:hypothetical protein
MHKKICPKCNSRDIDRIIYGFPIGRCEETKVRFGGCFVGPTDPEFACNSCGFAWSDNHKRVK